MITIIIINIIIIIIIMFVYLFISCTLEAAADHSSAELREGAMRSSTEPPLSQCSIVL